MKVKKIFTYEWDAIAGVITAVAASVLHLLHVLDEKLMLSIVLALIALLFTNFMRHSRNNELAAEKIELTAADVQRIQAGLKLPEAVLIGPRQIRACHDRFTAHMRGETIWYNVCLSMYRTPALFDALLRPAIENPAISSILFILDDRQIDVWNTTILPQVENCAGGKKVLEPCWRSLDKNISFILADSHASDGAEALLSFWGEPFMAEATERSVPRFVFHVNKHAELIPHLIELSRSHRLGAASSA
ncbi:MAG: hypothetical protein L6Q60_01455 [Rhodocyclaceae bacterium]|nr:hypothetical protein [Rhodocyclaceae bacterium]